MQAGSHLTKRATSNCCDFEIIGVMADTKRATWVTDDWQRRGGASARRRALPSQQRQWHATCRLIQSSPQLHSPQREPPDALAPATIFTTSPQQSSAGPLQHAPHRRPQRSPLVPSWKTHYCRFTGISLSIRSLILLRMIRPLPALLMRKWQLRFKAELDYLISDNLVSYGSTRNRFGGHSRVLKVKLQKRRVR